MKQRLAILPTLLLWMLQLLPLGSCTQTTPDPPQTTVIETSDTTTSDTTIKRVKEKRYSLMSELGKSYFLRDPNKMHIFAGHEMGIEPFRKNADFLAVRDSILRDSILVFVNDSTHYRKKKMFYSYPYLTKETKQLIVDISERFHQKLEEKNMGDYSILVTSCLRTLESQSTLCSSNLNATRDTTSHAFGATFDLSYWEFYNNTTNQVVRYKNLQNLLHKVIKDVRNEKKCLVIKETGQFCFHCTVIQ